MGKHFNEFDSSRNILIIGGAGYLGLCLTRNLVNSGYSPTILTPNPEKTSSPDFMKKVNVIRGSVTDRNLLEDLIQERDNVINLAGFIDKRGSNPLKSLIVNCFGELNVLESIKKYNPKTHHIFLGTRAQFGKIGKNGMLVSENQPQRPTSIYGIHKKICEEHIRHYQTVYNIKVTSLRSVGIYGPGVVGEPRHFISDLVKKCLHEENLILNSDGLQIHDFIYIEDITNLIQKLVETKTEGFYNVGSGVGFPMREIVEMIKTKCNSQSKIIYRVPSLRENHLNLDGCVIDIRKISKKTGWKPKEDLYSGIDKTINWFKENKKNE